MGKEPRKPASGPEPEGGETPKESAAPAGIPAEDPAAAEFAAETARADRLAPESTPDYKDRWLRAEAELQNTRRRMMREREDAVRAREERILLDVIDVLDDLERALAALPKEQSDGGWAQGVALTAQRMRDTLARHGVLPVPAVGEPFDPAVHDALLEIPAPEGITPGHVAQEILRGYRRGDRALRAARVVVAKPER